MQTTQFTAMVFGNTGANSLSMEQGTTLTIGAGTTLSGNISNIGDSLFQEGTRTLVNDGTISSNVAGNTTTITPTDVVNNGTLEVVNGAVVDVQTASPLDNNGNVNVATASELLLSNGMDQNSGVTNVDGSITVGNGQVKVNGGSVVGKGVIHGNVSNVGGLIGPGHSPGKLTFDGDYTQSGSGKLLIEIAGYLPGIDYDLLSIMGRANLGGSLEFRLLNGFQLQSGDRLRFLNYASYAGAFSSVVGLNGYNYRVGYDGLDSNGVDQYAYLQVLGDDPNAVPEFGTLPIFAILLCLGGIALGRQRRRLQR
jgi:hypothetical protein